MVDVLTSRISGAASTERGVTFLSGPAPITMTWSELHERSQGVARVLRRQFSVEPGDHVALLGSSGPAIVTAIQAVWLCGASVTILPLPRRVQSMDLWCRRLRSRLDHIDARLTIFDAQVLQVLEPTQLTQDWVSAEWLYDEGPGTAAVPLPEPDEKTAAILQFTSGSTADPRVAVLTHGQVCANLSAIAAAAEFDPSSDRALSWLPLFHDMGLIGFLTVPMTTGMDLVLASPEQFVSAPGMWMKWVSGWQASVIGAPNFAYSMSAQLLPRQENLDLSSVRIAMNGAEMISRRVVERFNEAAAGKGFSPDAMFCVYGLAEATLAVTFPRPGSGFRLSESGRYPSLGTPVPGMECRIDTSAVRGLSPGTGEIEIRGPSVMSGYYADPEATKDTFDGGWLRTGDIGYLDANGLVVCDRLKDLIIISGRNVHCYEVEETAATIPKVRPGNVIAFGVLDSERDREDLVVVAEVRGSADTSVAGAIGDAVVDSVGVRPLEVLLVPPGRLPKTSSGKLQRSLCREQFLSGSLTSASPVG